MRRSRTRLDEELSESLEILRARGLLRTLERSDGLDFESNDYLGWARDPAFRDELLERLAAWAKLPRARLAPGSRLLGGQLEEHERLEARLADWLQEEAVLLFPSGWQANCALIPALAGPEDRVISDALNHASLIDAVRLSRAEKIVVPHLDLDAYRKALEQSPPRGRTLVVVESVYSMDGDLTPLRALYDLCERHGAQLLVDEAHATGLYGSRGTGRVEEGGLEGALAARTVTFGKALALQGACLAGSRTLIEWLLQRARPFVFSTAVSPLLLAGVEVALDRLKARPDQGRRARQMARRLRSRLVALGLPVREDDSPIVPLVLGTNARALAVAERLRTSGFAVRAVRPPTVPEGTARLRLSVHADHAEEDLDRLAESIGEAVR